MFVGIDLRAEGLNCVSLDDGLRVEKTGLVPTDDLVNMPSWILDSRVIAVDAPAAVSTAPHAADDSLSPKFREARCAEIELGRRCGSWVPWVAPRAAPPDGWMKTGFDLYDVLSRMSHAQVIEVYPHAGFRELARRKQLAKKTRVAGTRERVALLNAAGLRTKHLACEVVPLPVEL